MGASHGAGKFDQNTLRKEEIHGRSSEDPIIPGQYGANESKRLFRNLLALGTSFTLLFTAFMAMANLQSSINSKGGIGLDALAALYVAYLVSSLLFPSLFLAKLKSKITIVVAISGYIVYQAAQFYPRLETLLPAGILLGACAAQLWAAQGTYITLISEEYAKLTGATAERVLQRFFGIFFLCFHSAQVWGNLISSLILSSTLSSQSILTNETNQPKAVNLNLCGANFRPNLIVDPTIFNNDTQTEFNEVVERPHDSKIQLITGIFVACSVAAGLLIFFAVDSLARYGENERELVTKQKWYSLLIATVKHWKKPSQTLLIPLSIWTGVQEAFIGAEFTVGYISCAWGVENIGFVMLCFGICASISSIMTGKVMQYVGRPLVFGTGVLLNLACLVTMLKWQPNPAQPIVFFLISGAWGIADGVWSPQIRALYGGLFSDTREAAFSNAGLWLSLGFLLVYVSANRINMETKLYLCIGLLASAAIGYAIVEVITRVSSRKSQHK